MISEPESEVDLVFSEQDENLPSLPLSNKSVSSSYSSNFIFSRRLFSQLGLIGWDRRKTVDLLKKDERLLREIKHLDNQVRIQMYLGLAI